MRVYVAVSGPPPPPPRGRVELINEMNSQLNSNAGVNYENLFVLSLRFSPNAPFWELFHCRCLVLKPVIQQKRRPRGRRNNSRGEFVL